MILHRDAADIGETLVDLQVPAVGREESQANWGGVVDQLQGRLWRQQRAENRRDWIAAAS